MEQGKRRRGRPSEGKVTRVFTIDQEIAGVLDRMPDGERSQFVNDWLGENEQLVSAVLEGENTMDRARLQGKRDEYTKMVGGFAVARMGDNTFDYFPTGQPPHRDGEPDKGATIVEKWSWNGSRWRQIA